MAKLRKMLGSLQDPQVVELMRCIETQSKVTLSRWTKAYVEKRYIPYLRQCGKMDERLEAALCMVEKLTSGSISTKDARPILAEARKVAQEESDVVCQAGARAIATACATYLTPTNALGFVFYGAALVAYQKAGTNATVEEYDRLAEGEIGQVLISLKENMVKEEPNPVKVNWNC